MPNNSQSDIMRQEKKRNRTSVANGTRLGGSSIAARIAKKRKRSPGQLVLPSNWQNVLHKRLPHMEEAKQGMPEAWQQCPGMAFVPRSLYRGLGAGVSPSTDERGLSSSGLVSGIKKAEKTRPTMPIQAKVMKPAV